MPTILQPIPVEKIRLVVFDLDGTLIDSRIDLCNSINAMLRNYHRHELPDHVIASYIGDGAGMLVRRALGDPDDEHFVDEALQFFLNYYRVHKLDFTTVYDGVFPALDVLQTTQRPMAVLTNKPVNPSREICKAFGLDRYFFQNYGGNSFRTKKPDPHGLETLIQEAGVKPEETVMIGDSDVDVCTARNAGAWAIGCLFGLSPHTLEAAPPDVLVNRPLEWLEALAVD